MRNLLLPTIILTSNILLASCLAPKSLNHFSVEPDAVDENLVNFALPENGGVLWVSQDNPNHKGSTLNNGIKSSEDWDKGEGWVAHFGGRYPYGQFFEYGNRSLRALDRHDFDEKNYRWRGLRGKTNYGELQAAMGWVVIEFPQKKLINRVEVYTVDSKELPASTYGVNHLLLQYWVSQAKSWRDADILGKSKGQQFAGIRNIKTGKVSLRFKPVRTEKIRLAILWTNDSKKYQLPLLGSWNEAAEGTIRLVEVEVYGSEKKKDTEFLSK